MRILKTLLSALLVAALASACSSNVQDFTFETDWEAICSQAPELCNAGNAPYVGDFDVATVCGNAPELCGVETGPRFDFVDWNTFCDIAPDRCQLPEGELAEGTDLCEDYPELCTQSELEATRIQPTPVEREGF